MGTESETINLRLPLTLLEETEEAARTEGYSMQVLIMVALKERLDQLDRARRSGIRFSPA